MAAVDMDVAIGHRMAKSEHFDVLIIGAVFPASVGPTGCENDAPGGRRNS